MKRIGVLAALLLLVSATGCANLNPPSNLTDAQFQSLVQQDQIQAQQMASAATDVTLASISDAKTRTEVGQYANKMAVAINTATQGPNFDLTGIQPLVDTFLAKVSPQEKQLIDALINGVSLGVEDILSNNATLAANRKVILVKALLSSASQGIISQTTGLTIRRADLAKALGGK